MHYRKYEFSTEAEAQVYCDEVASANDGSVAIVLERSFNGNFRVDALLTNVLAGYGPYEVWPHPEEAYHYFMGQKHLYVQAFEAHNG